MCWSHCRAGLGLSGAAAFPQPCGLRAFLPRLALVLEEQQTSIPTRTGRKALQGVPHPSSGDSCPVLQLLLTLQGALSWHPFSRCWQFERQRLFASVQSLFPPWAILPTVAASICSEPPENPFAPHPLPASSVTLSRCRFSALVAHHVSGA